jgi:hypothetical protein
MSKETNTKGIIGGVLGIITSFAGFAWITSLTIFMTDLSNYAEIINFAAGFPIPNLGLSAYNGIVLSLIVPYPNSVNLPVITSIIFMGVLIVFGFMLGQGFRFYSGSSFSAFGAQVTMKRNIRGSLYFECSSSGALIAGILIFMGGIFQTTIVYNFLRTPLTDIFTPLSIPEFLYTWIGLVVLGVVLIILGLATIRIRGLVKWRDFAMVAGVLSIVCGAVFCLFVIVGILYSTQLAYFGYQLLIALSYPTSASMASAVVSSFELTVMLSLVGFGIMLVVSVLWTRIFLAPSSSK